MERFKTGKVGSNPGLKGRENALRPPVLFHSLFHFISLSFSCAVDGACDPAFILALENWNVFQPRLRRALGASVDVTDARQRAASSAWDPDRGERS